VTSADCQVQHRELLDETGAGERPSLDGRIALMRPQIVRLRADIFCFQEVNGQELGARTLAQLIGVLLRCCHRDSLHGLQAMIDGLRATGRARRVSITRERRQSSGSGTR
jgi:hypothetical protein